MGSFVFWVTLDVKRIFVLTPGWGLYFFILIVDERWWSSTTIVPISGQPVSWSWWLLTISVFSVRMTTLVTGYPIWLVRIVSIWAIRDSDQFGQVFSPTEAFRSASVIFRSDPRPPLTARTMDYPRRYAPRTLPRSGSCPVEKPSFWSSTCCCQSEKGVW